MHRIARVEDGSVVETRDMGLDSLPDHMRDGWRAISGSPPNYDRNTHSCSGPEYKIQGDQVVAVWVVTPRSPDEIRATAIADVDQFFMVAWSTFFLGNPARTQEREIMAEIAIRCSSPDPAVASANRAIMEAEGAIHGQTADQRIAARISARATAHIAGSKLSLLRQAAMTAISAASLDAIAGIVATAKAEMDAVA